MLEIKTQIGERNREFGTEKRGILFGKKINKIEEQSNKKVNKLIKSGKRDPKCLSLRLVKCKTKIKLIRLNKVGFKEENLDMDGKKISHNRNEED